MPACYCTSLEAPRSGQLSNHLLVASQHAFLPTWAADVEADSGVVVFSCVVYLELQPTAPAASFDAPIQVRSAASGGTALCCAGHQGDVDKVGRAVCKVVSIEICFRVGSLGMRCSEQGWKKFGLTAGVVQVVALMSGRLLMNRLHIVLLLFSSAWRTQRMCVCTWHPGTH
jgi:hypothetical protein